MLSPIQSQAITVIESALLPATNPLLSPLSGSTLRRAGFSTCWLRVVRRDGIARTLPRHHEPLGMREARFQHRRDRLGARLGELEIRWEGDGVNRIGVGVAVDMNGARLAVERGGDLGRDRGEGIVDLCAA